MIPHLALMVATDEVEGLSMHVTAARVPAFLAKRVLASRLGGRGRPCSAPLELLWGLRLDLHQEYSNIQPPTRSAGAPALMKVLKDSKHSGCHGKHHHAAGA